MVSTSTYTADTRHTELGYFGIKHTPRRTWSVAPTSFPTKCAKSPEYRHLMPHNVSHPLVFTIEEDLTDDATGLRSSELGLRVVLSRQLMTWIDECLSQPITYMVSLVG
jgi:hypothetical protein